MDTLESEYSFLAPTWKLPPVATPSMYSHIYGTSYLSNDPDLGLDWILWKNTLYNSRYAPIHVPSAVPHSDYSTLSHYPVIISATIVPQQQNSQIPIEQRTAQSRSFNYQPPNNLHQDNTKPHNSVNLTNNQYQNSIKPHSSVNITNNEHQSRIYDSHNHQPINKIVNREITYPTNIQNNLPRPSTQKRRVQVVDYSRQTPSTSINEYMTGRNSSIPNRVPDTNKTQSKSKSFVSNTPRDHNEENRFGYTGNYVNVHEYLYGLSAPDPGSYVDAYRQHQRRLHDEKVNRKSVLSDYKNFAQNGGFGPAFGNTDHRAYKEKINNENRRKSYAKSVREINQIKNEEQKRLQSNYGQHSNRTPSVPKNQRAREYADTIAKPLHTKPLSSTELISQLPVIPPISIIPLPTNIRRSSLDTISTANLLSREFDINQTRHTPSLSPTPRKKRQVRFHSFDLVRRRSSTFINSPSYNLNQTDPSTNYFRTRKSASKIFEEEEEYNRKKNYESFQKSSNLSRQSKLNKNKIKTATDVINQTCKSSHMGTTTTTNNNSKKIILNKNIISQPSIPIPDRKLPINSRLHMAFKNKPDHNTDDNDSFHK
ncbi:unnamed protein product [Adineta steineri]|uniref:Uncharacterized protein n=1 Tax=Adineta steineri TaxID=433720 RepID=A0A818GZZ9_9BILA|nr:unnamed protein product [Adineta steineri]CAF3500042.1 unnamed protein product [Adineta steineri]